MTQDRKRETEREMFITPQIVTVKGPQDQEGIKNAAKIEPNSGKSEATATGKRRISYSDALKAVTTADQLWSVQRKSLSY